MTVQLVTRSEERGIVMRRFAFTMIELIFVIVILGILAAVALPRLSATRDDAMATASLENFNEAVKQVQATSYSQGIIEADLTTLIPTSSTILVTATTFTARTKAVGGTNCARGTISGNDLVITVLSTAGNCAIFANKSAGTIPLLGDTVVR